MVFFCVSPGQAKQAGWARGMKNGEKTAGMRNAAFLTILQAQLRNGECSVDKSLLV
jgi:hypothetical protein